MLRSSTKTTSFLPAGGPKVSLVRFSIDASMAVCTSSEEVRDEKLMPSVVNLSGLRLPRYLEITVVLAVPLSPTKRHAPRTETTESSSHVERTVSRVGTMIDENLPSGGGSYVGTRSVHGFQRFCSKSKV